MTMESDLTTLLKGLCPRVFPDFAPSGTAAPWITYQHIGGQPLRYADNTAADKRHTHLQVNVWHASRLDALQLMRQVEDALCATAVFVARPVSEPTSQAEEDMLPSMYGFLQDFEIWSQRT